MKVDGADTEVGSSKIDGHVETLAMVQPCARALSIAVIRDAYLLCTIGDGSDIGGDLAHGGA